MTQYVINIGAVPDDGTGDPLRTAFNETNLNFDQVFAAGPVLSNIQIANNKILTTNTNGNLVLAPNGTGVVQSNVSIVPNAANIRNLGSTTRRWSTVYAQYLDVSANLNITGNIVYNGDLNVDGNLTVQGNIIQVGNIVTETLTIQLANAASTANAANGSGITVGANDNIATLLYNSTGNVWTTNIGLSSVGNITAPYFFGNGSQLTGVTASGVAAAALTGNTLSPNVLFSSLTSVGTLANLSVSGNITSGNLQVTGGVSGNTVTAVANVTGGNILTTGIVTATGNVTGNYFIGNGSQLTGLAATYGNANAVAYGESGWAGNIVPSGNAVYSLGNATNQWNDLYVSNATIFMNNVPISLSAGNVLTVNSEDVVVASNTGLVSVSSIDIGTTNFLVGDDDYLVFEGLVPGGIRPAETDTYNLGNVGKIWSEIHANVYYGNGSQLTGISTANTGNVTFNDVNIIGTGNLNLQPNDASNEYLNIYLTGNADIHVAAGGSGGNVILGTDEEANIAVLQGGNVAIQAGNVSGTKTWTFDTAGNLTLPGNTSSINYANGNPYGGGGSANTGNVTFTDQIVIGTGTNDGGGGLYLAPGNASIANSAVQYLRVRGGDYPTHIHLDTGNNQYFDQYFGADSKFVKLEANGNVVINADDSGANSASWTFDITGNLTFPTGNLVIIPDDPAGNIASIASTDHPLGILSTGANGAVSSLWVEDIGNVGTSNIAAVYANPTPGSKIVRIAVGQNGNAGPNLWDFNANGTLAVSGNINFSGDASAAPSLNDFFSVTSAANFAIVTDNANADHTWTFGANGNLTAPGNISAVGNIISGNLTVGSGTITGGNVNGANFNGNVAFGTGTVGGSGNITGGNLITTGSGGNITMTGGNITGALRVATTPTALANLTAIAGGRAFVNNANLVAAGNFGNQVGSGGSNVVPVWSDGSNWYIG